LNNARSRFDAASSACDTVMQLKVQEGRERLALAAASLDALSPLEYCSVVTRSRRMQQESLYAMRHQ